MPAQIGDERESQLAAIRRPAPPPRVVRLVHERRVVARQRDEQRIALDLARERVGGDERIGRLEIGSRREHQHIVRALRRDARRRHEQERGRDAR